MPRPVIAIFWLALLVLVAPSSDAQPHEMKFKNSVATDDRTPWGRAATRFADLIRERTQGRIHIENHWAGELFAGKGINEFTLLSQGMADFAFGSTTNWTPQVPELYLFTLPFLFSSYAALDAVQAGEPGRRIFDAIESRGVVPLAWGDNGFRELTNRKRSIRDPKDLAGLTIRVVVVPFAETFLALGAAPVSLHFEKTLEALAEGTLDGLESPIAGTIVGRELWRSQKHLTVWGYAADPIVVAVSGRTWKALSAGDREIIRTTAVEVANWQKIEARRGLDGSTETLDALRANGMEVIVLSPSERAVFRNSTRAVYARWAAQAGNDLVASAERIVNQTAAAQTDSPPSTAEEWVYVTNEDSNDLTIIDARSLRVVATIPVGKRPRGVRIGPSGRHVYVALSGAPKCPPSMPDAECSALGADETADGIAVVDVVARRLERVLPSGSDPEQFDISADGSRLYVSNENVDAATILDLLSGSVLQTVSVGREPEGVRIRPDEKVVYITGEADHDLTGLDAQTGDVVSRIAVGRRPRDLDFLPDGSKAYVSAEVDGVVSVVDVAHEEVIRSIRLPEGSRPMGVAVAPDGSRVYVSNGRGGTISVIATATDSVIATIPVGIRPWGLAVSGDGRRLYTANGPSDDVSVIDTEKLQVIGRLSVGETPWGVAVGPKPTAAGD